MEISITKKVFSVSVLFSRYQRKGLLFFNVDIKNNIEEKSIAIETLLIGVSIYSKVTSDVFGNLSTINNCYLSSIIYFIGNHFSLNGLTVFTEYNGLFFKDLPMNVQNKILETEVLLDIFNPKTDQAVIDVFKD